MKMIIRTTLLSTLLATFAMSGAALAQSASQQMGEAGHSAESALSHAWHGTETAADDTALTAKVKTALHEDKITTGTDIHVTTVAGVVTLRGAVPSSEVSSHAEQVARNTTGVKGVKNKLKWP
jgi:hyperosmotically inducible periplasmic protein